MLKAMPWVSTNAGEREGKLKKGLPDPSGGAWDDRS